MAQCDICSGPLDVPDDPRTLSCGGTCCACMASAGDPDCAESLRVAGYEPDPNEASWKWFRSTPTS